MVFATPDKPRLLPPFLHALTFLALHSPRQGPRAANILLLLPPVVEGPAILNLSSYIEGSWCWCWCCRSHRCRRPRPLLLLYRQKVCETRPSVFAMSRRRWNTIHERQNLHRLSLRGLEALQIADLIEYGSSSDENEDGSDGSSVSSESSSTISTNSASSSEDDTLAIVLPMLADAASLDTRINAYIEDGSIAFGLRLKIQDFNESECLTFFRFRKDDLQRTADLLWPRLEPYLEGDITEILCENRYRAPYETCFLICLARLSYPRRLRPEMEVIFGMRKSHISACFKTFSEALFEVASQYLLNVNIWAPRMPMYATKIGKKTGNLINIIWGFLDGTIRRIRRPVRCQSQAYTRYKRCHALKFQSVVTPDGFIAHLTGPFMGRDHDSRMLAESLLLPALQQLMPADGTGGPIYCMYSDLAYPTSAWLMKGFVNAAEGSPEKAFNTAMSKVRIVVEWGFKNIVQQWQFLDFQQTMMILKMPIGQYYVNAAFLTNLRNCLYGGQIGNHFKCEPLSLEQYLGLIDDP